MRYSATWKQILKPSLQHCMNPRHMETLSHVLPSSLAFRLPWCSLDFRALTNAAVRLLQEAVAKLRHLQGFAMGLRADSVPLGLESHREIRSKPEIETHPYVTWRKCVLTLQHGQIGGGGGGL